MSLLIGREEWPSAEQLILGDEDIEIAEASAIKTTEYRGSRIKLLLIHVGSGLRGIDHPGAGPNADLGALKPGRRQGSYRYNRLFLVAKGGQLHAEPLELQNCTTH